VAADPSMRLSEACRSGIRCPPWRAAKDGTAPRPVRLLRRLPAMWSLGVPVLLGSSHKSFIGAVTGRDVENRLPGLLALIALAWSAGVAIIRLRDVPQTCDTGRVLEAV
jgi:dihydropteroate synthase